MAESFDELSVIGNFLFVQVFKVGVGLAEEDGGKDLGGLGFVDVGAVDGAGDDLVFDFFESGYDWCGEDGGFGAGCFFYYGFEPIFCETGAGAVVNGDEVDIFADELEGVCDGFVSLGAAVAEFYAVKGKIGAPFDLYDLVIFL